MKTIYYYQSFVGLHKLMTHLQDIDIITISSIHFDTDKHGEKHIYLNNNIPTNPMFNKLWTETESCSSQGVTIMLMIGGAGGAYTELFNDFTVYYPQLKQLLNEKTFIGGINLDIEEEVDINKIKMLIRLLKDDFPDFKISMAPVAESMTTDSIGMGGFSYKELYSSYEGTLIDWFNVQCYNSFSFETYDNIIKNGYPSRKIVMGHESGQFDKTTFQKALNVVTQCVTTYPAMCGVYDWEYLNAPPDENDCSLWCKLMKGSSL
jgi:hypothetical protein